MKTFQGFSYTIEEDGVQIWEGDGKMPKNNRIMEHWYFKPMAFLNSKMLQQQVKHPVEIKNISWATDKQVESKILKIIKGQNLMKKHSESVSSAEPKRKKGDHILQVSEGSVVLYKVQGISQSEYGKSYNLAPLRIIETDTDDHRVQSVYSPFCHVVDNFKDKFKFVQGKRLQELLTQGFEFTGRR